MNHQTNNSSNIQIADSSTKWTPKHIDIVSTIFVATLLVSNLAAVKLFRLGPATFTAGILVFPITYIFGDILTEVYGFKRARRIIYLGLFANIFMALILWVAIALPPADGWALQDQFKAVHSFIPRIIIASVMGYLAGELINSFVISKLKVATHGRHLWLRTISSTIIGQMADTIIFVTIAFAGTLPNGLIVAAIISGWLFKVIYESAATPLTYLFVNKFKRLEGIDHFDQ